MRLAFIKFLLFSSLITQSACSAFDHQSEIRRLAEFNRIHVRGLAEVFLIQSEFESIEVKVSGMPVSDVLTWIEDDTLFINTQGSHRGESVKVYVNYDNLSEIKTAGSAEITGENTLKTEHLAVTTSDSGDIKHLDTLSTTLTVNITGNGNASLNVDDLSVTMKNAGDLSISSLAKNQNIRSYGSSGSLNNSKLNHAK
jgi:hypothetical protein